MDCSHNGRIGSDASTDRTPGNSHPVFVLLAIYFIFVFVRFVVSLLIEYPLIASDEALYKIVAQSYFLSGSFYNTAGLGFPGVTPPNVLYPLLISPCFWFGQNFFIAIKLINSLLMNAAIFPIYLMAREFLNKKDALFICIVVLALPFFNFINFVMVEALVFPLFIACFYLAFKTIATMRPKYALLTGAFLVISFFCKTTALFSVIAIALSCLVLRLLGLKRSFFIGIRPAVVSIAAILCFGLISYLLLQRFFIDWFYYFNVEIRHRIKSFLSFSAITFPPPGEAIQMILAHLDTVSIAYLIPFYVIILALIVEGRNRFLKEMDKNLIFVVMLLSFFFVYLIAVLKFIFGLYAIPSEYIGRLHARYYFMVSPLFIIGFSTFFPWLKWGIKERIILLVTGVIVILSGVLFFLPKYVSLGLAIVDNPDIAWYVHPNRLLVIPVALVFTLTMLYYVMSARPSRSVFLWGLFCYSIIGNYGEVRALIYYDALNVTRFKPCMDFISWQLPKKDSRVVIVDSTRWYQYMLPFWRTFNYVGVDRLPKGTKIDRQSIPGAADFLILFDDYELDFPEGSAVTEGRCKIIALHKSGYGFNRKLPYQFDDTLRFTEGGNYIGYVGTGWSHPEVGYVWSDGPVSRLHVPLMSSDFDLMVRVNCSPFLAPPRLKRQRVRILAGGIERCNWTIEGRGEYRCLIPASAIKNSVLDLTFEFPDATSPKESNLSDDDRKLALAFQSLIITKADEIPVNSERK